MGLPSNNPLRSPQRVRAGSPIEARAYNELVDTVRALIQRGIPQVPQVVAGPQLLPFEITVTDDTLKAAPGTLDGDAIAETTESSPANGTWYLEATITINATTGVVTDTDVAWVTSESTDTTTDFHFTIGTVTVSAGVPDASSIVQAAFGPILAIVHGEVDDKWGVLIF